VRWPDRTQPLRGVVLGVVAVVAVTLVLTPIREEFSPAAPTTLLLVPVVLAAVVGGWMAAITTAIVATAALAFAFVPPLNSFRFHGDALAVPVFMMVAVAVGAVVASEVHRRRLAEEANRVSLLEQVDRQRAALLRSVSHDLRTPLATIRAAASELQAGAVRDEATRAELLALVGDQAGRLDRLVANLLDLSRIEAGALHPDRQAVDIGELVADRLTSLSGVFRDVGVQVSIDADLPLVSADHSQLGQVLVNLLENAARHSPSGGTVTVRAVAVTGGPVEVTVADEGKGVLPDDAAHIFEPFRTGRGSNSTGIGLAICKAVVEANGGEIWLDQDTARGASFHFTVPVCDG
jgi:two-component system sensor histidine kinase KdpD